LYNKDLGVIYIKKTLIIVSFLVILFIAVFIFINHKNGLETIGDDITENIVTFQEENLKTTNEIKETEEQPEEESILYTEDPIKDFLSEKVNQTIEFFLNKNLHIVAIGDSLTEGVGDETENGGYVGILNDKINSEGKVASFKNLGKLGNKTNQLLTRLNEEEDVIKEISKADIILITIGANDVMQVFKENFTNLNLDVFEEEKVDYESRLQQIFVKMNELNEEATIYLIGFYNPFQRYFGEIEELNTINDSWNEVGELVTNQYSNVHYIPVNDLFEGLDEDYLADDYFHLNYLGYHLMAERVLEYLTKEEGELNVGTTSN